MNKIKEQTKKSKAFRKELANNKLLWIADELKEFEVEVKNIKGGKVNTRVMFELCDVYGLVLLAEKDGKVDKLSILSVLKRKMSYDALKLLSIVNVQDLGSFISKWNESQVRRGRKALSDVKLLAMISDLIEYSHQIVRANYSEIFLPSQTKLETK